MIAGSPEFDVILLSNCNYLDEIDEGLPDVGAAALL
jgi:hypothetical protein